MRAPLQTPIRGPSQQTLSSTMGGQRSGMASARGDRRAVTTWMTSPGAALSDTLALTHICSIKKNSQTALSSTCLQRYLPQSLPRSLIPTVSAHVNRAITGHARIFVLRLTEQHPSARRSDAFIFSPCRSRVVLTLGLGEQSR